MDVYTWAAPGVWLGVAYGASMMRHSIKNVVGGGGGGGDTPPPLPDKGCGKIFIMGYIGVLSSSAYKSWPVGWQAKNKTKQTNYMGVTPCHNHPPPPPPRRHPCVYIFTRVEGKFTISGWSEGCYLKYKIMFDEHGTGGTLCSLCTSSFSDRSGLALEPSKRAEKLISCGFLQSLSILLIGISSFL